MRWTDCFAQVSPHTVLLTRSEEAAFFDPEATRIGGVLIHHAGRGDPPSAQKTAGASEVILGHLFLRSTRIVGDSDLVEALLSFRVPRPAADCGPEGIPPELARRLIAGGILVPLEPEVAWRVRVEEGITRLAFKTWGGLGDILMCSPVLRAVKAVAPFVSTAVVANNSREARLVEFNPYVDDVIVCERPPPADLAGDTLFFEPRYGMLSPSGRWHHRVGRYVGEFIGIPIDDNTPLLYLGKSEDASGMRLTKELGPFIAIHPDASKPQKHWPRAKWAELIERLAPIPVVQVGAETYPAIPAASDYRGLDILYSCALIKHASLFIGVDSVMQHAAAAWRVPSVILFGPSPPSVFGHPGAINLRALECRCYRRVQHWIACERGCMDRLSVDHVLEAVEAVLRPRVSGRGSGPCRTGNMHRKADPESCRPSPA